MILSGHWSYRKKPQLPKSNLQDFLLHFSRIPDFPTWIKKKKVQRLGMGLHLMPGLGFFFCLVVFPCPSCRKNSLLELQAQEKDVPRGVGKKIFWFSLSVKDTEGLKIHPKLIQ